MFFTILLFALVVPCGLHLFVYCVVRAICGGIFDVFVEIFSCARRPVLALSSSAVVRPWCPEVGLRFLDLTFRELAQSDVGIF